MATLYDMQRVNLGPLTTTWTPPPACTIPIGALGAPNFTVAWQGNACDPELGPSDTTSCYPPASSGVPSPTAPFLGWGYYSPGVVCPAGYTSACTATGGGASDWYVQFSVKMGETAVGCCPTGYTCTNNNGQTCGSIAATTTVRTAACQTGGTGSVLVQRTLPDRTISLSTLTVFAPMYQLNHYPSDISSSTSNSTPPASITDSPTSNSNGGSSQNTAGGSTTDGLTPGATAGIAVGAALAGILLAVGAFFLVRKYRRDKSGQTMRKDTAADELQLNYHVAGHVHEMESKDAVKRQEMRGDLAPVYEMGNLHAAELPGSHEYHDDGRYNGR